MYLKHKANKVRFFFTGSGERMEKRSWVCTVFTQMCILIGLYIALNLGQPQIRSGYRRRIGDRFNEVCFITVRGGFRPLNQQFHLLKLIEKVARTSDARFVVNISELGEDDPLMKNGTKIIRSLEIPWYTTKTSERGSDHFVAQIRLPYGKSLDLIGMDTGSLKDSVPKSLNGLGDEQTQWLRGELRSTQSDWRIITGFHQLISCGDNEYKMEAMQDFEALHDLFSKYRVNMYLSGRVCSQHICNGGLLYVEPHSSSLCGNSSGFCRDIVDGFLLHRVGSFKIVTYFINTAGEILQKRVVQQQTKVAL